ncbi:IS630 transposase-related protein [Candidatus Regiella insecticola]|uniref:IS630 transposase-related protein n=1 Tax=Candidatus Regiella insecticola TaxID=138073 RepID=UPI002A4E1277|nr:type 4b pilus protein PilO2 [Candidatus Regiella insecticola]
MSNEKKPIRLVTYNNKVFVVGLEWRAIKGGLHYMKEVKAIGKRENLDVVAIRQNDSIQAGFAPKFSVPLKGKYSLAVSLVSLIPGKWLAVIPLDKDDLNTDYIVMASTGGLVMPWTDKIVSPAVELAPYFMMYTNLMTYPLKFRQHVLAIKEKLTYAKTASRFGVGMASLMRWNRRITPCTTHNKPATKIDMEALAQDVATYPDDYQYERAQRFGVSAQGIRHALKRLRVSRKKNTSASQS